MWSLVGQKDETKELFLILVIQDAELAIGQYRLGVQGTCGLNNPWHHLRKISSWVGNPGKPPYVTPRGSAGLKKSHVLNIRIVYDCTSCCRGYTCTSHHVLEPFLVWPNCRTLKMKISEVRALVHGKGVNQPRSAAAIDILSAVKMSIFLRWPKSRVAIFKVQCSLLDTVKINQFFSFFRMTRLNGRASPSTGSTRSTR